MRNIYLPVLICIVYFQAFAQTGGGTFAGSYTEPGEGTTLNSIHPTRDGGYIVIASAFQPYNDVIVLKLDSAGRAVWKNNYVVSGQISQVICIQEDPSGYIALLALGGAGINQTLMVMRLDTIGALVWQNTYPYSTGVYPLFIEPTTDGGYLVSAQQVPSGAYSLLGLKLDSTGAIVWQKGFGTFASYGSIHATRDGGAIVAASPDPGNIVVGRVIKLDAAGNAEWERGYSFSVDTVFTSVRLTPDGGFAVSGNLTYQVISGESSALLMKLDHEGNVLSTFTYGSSSCIAENATEAQNLVGGGYLLNLGNCGQVSGGVARIDDTGAILWQQGSNEVGGFSPTLDGGYIAGGASLTEAILVEKANAAGGLPACAEKLPLDLVAVQAPAVTVTDIQTVTGVTTTAPSPVVVTVTPAVVGVKSGCE